MRDWLVADVSTATCECPQSKFWRQNRFLSKPDEGGIVSNYGKMTHVQVESELLNSSHHSHALEFPRREQSFRFREAIGDNVFSVRRVCLQQDSSKHGGTGIGVNESLYGVVKMRKCKRLQ